VRTLRSEEDNSSPKRINDQVFHRVVLDIVRDEGELVVDGGRGDGHVGDRQGGSLLGVIAFQEARQTLESRRKVAISAGGHLPTTLFVLPSQL